MHTEASPAAWWQRPVVVDAVIALVLAVVLVILVRVASEAGARPVDAVAYALVLSIAAIQMLRRAYPITVLVASFVLDFAYHALTYPAIGVAIPLAVPLFTVAVLGHVAAVAVVVTGVLGTLVWLMFGESQPFLSSLGVVVREGAIMVAVVMAGFANRGRRLLAAETRERDRLYMSPATAKTHVSRAMTKLGVRDRAQLVVLGYETGLVTPGGAG